MRRRGSDGITVVSMEESQCDPLERKAKIAKLWEILGKLILYGSR